MACDRRTHEELLAVVVAYRAYRLGHVGDRARPDLDRLIRILKEALDVRRTPAVPAPHDACSP